MHSFYERKELLKREFFLVYLGTGLNVPTGSEINWGHFSWQAFPLFFIYFHVTINCDNNSFSEVYYV